MKNPQALERQPPKTKALAKISKSHPPLDECAIVRQAQNKSTPWGEQAHEKLKTLSRRIAEAAENRLALEEVEEAALAREMLVQYSKMDLAAVIEHEGGLKKLARRLEAQLKLTRKLIANAREGVRLSTYVEQSQKAGGYAELVFVDENGRRQWRVY